MQEISGLCAPSRALTLLPSREKPSLVYFFSPAEPVGSACPLSPLRKQCAYILDKGADGRLQITWPLGSFLSRELGRTAPSHHSCSLPSHILITEPGDTGHGQCPASYPHQLADHTLKVNLENAEAQHTEEVGRPLCPETPRAEVKPHGSCLTGWQQAPLSAI